MNGNHNINHYTHSLTEDITVKAALKNIEVYTKWFTIKEIIFED